MRGTDDLCRRLIDLSPDGILLGENGLIVFLNPAAVRLLGATSPERLVGRSLFDIFRSESHALVRDLL